MVTQRTTAPSNETEATAPEPTAEAKRPTPRTTRRVVAFLAAAGLASAAIAAVGIAPRTGQTAELTAATQTVNEARRMVNVVTPSRGGASYELRLPGSTAPLQSAVLYARTDGYLKRFHVDIGDRVKTGQLLAEIESPETDAQLNEARATLERSRADLVLASQRLDRVKALYNQQAAARSEYDDLTAEHNAALAAVRSHEALVSRLESEQSFQRVLAPFDGVVTQRNIELGSLVTSGSASSVTPLFRMEQTETLKVFVDVPQTGAPGVYNGQTVRVEVREYPGRGFEGKVVRTAGTLDPTTRTLRTEIHLPNPKGELLAGVYAQVKLPIADSRQALRIPASALVNDAAGSQVVTVGDGDTIHRRKVTLGRDFGKEVEVTSGLNAEDRLVLNPRDDLRDGEVIASRAPTTAPAH